MNLLKHFIAHVVQYTLRLALCTSHGAVQKLLPVTVNHHYE